MIIHIVMFKFKEENKKSNIKEVAEKLNSLSKLIPELKSIEVGVNFTDSDRAFDLSLYSTFETKEDLASYAIHPEHLKVVELIKSMTLESKVVDYIL
ncbi:Dabb family protein [Sulfurimonas xiamenensis]|uniref:Dabb family protein n=1 Tax=Sulfurimonas xiamenensis TaxID=2590021 RepID=A0AAJ4A443_9BACT|nr:Dabb family protein [Sulfurimonas xiamenensis]QFR43517.1 Dabb family protein [Sulfurimonas xiamenensis]